MRVNLEAEEEGLLGKPAPVSDAFRRVRVATIAFVSVGLVLASYALVCVGHSMISPRGEKTATPGSSFLEDLQVKVADANSSDTVVSSSEAPAGSDNAGSETAEGEVSSSGEPTSGGSPSSSKSSDSSTSGNFFVSSSSESPDSSSSGNFFVSSTEAPSGNGDSGEGETGNGDGGDNAGEIPAPANGEEGATGGNEGDGAEGGDQQCSNDKDDCTETKCCNSPGLVCYMKNTNWSSCLQQCEPGKPAPFDAPPYDTPWDCTVLGPPEALNSESSSAEPSQPPPSQPPSENSMTTTGDMLTTGDFGAVSPELAQCSSNAEDCRLTGCCQEPGQQCYEKNEYWGGCRSWCNEGEIFPGDGADHQSAWSCKIITKDDVPNVNFDDGVDRSQCSDKEDDCRDSKCCKNPALTCFAKDDKWASCHLHCVAGIHDADPPEWKTEWSCKALSADGAGSGDGNGAMDAALGGDAGGEVKEDDIAVR